MFAVATERPVIRATAATIDRETVDPGESVVVRATAANEGGSDGSREVTLTADGDSVATQRVDLDTDERATVAFEPTFDEPGTYDIAVDGALAGTLVVDDPGGDGDSGDGDANDVGPAGPDGTAADSPTEEPSGIDPSNLAGLGVLVLIVLASAALVRRMPKS